MAEPTRAAPFHFGAESLRQQATCHPFLRDIGDLVLRRHDFKWVEGLRSPERQHACFTAVPRTSQQPGFNADGTMANYPHRKRADGWCWAADWYPLLNGRLIDARRTGVNPVETAQFARFLGIVESEARAYFAARQRRLGDAKWALRLGVDWDMDGEILSDQTFHDWPHVELVRVVGWPTVNAEAA